MNGYTNNYQFCRARFGSGDGIFYQKLPDRQGG